MGGYATRVNRFLSLTLSLMMTVTSPLLSLRYALGPARLLRSFPLVRSPCSAWFFTLVRRRRRPTKTSVHATSFCLASGLEAVMPVEFLIPSLRIQVKERMTEETSEKIRLQQLLTLSETRVQSLAILELDQQRRRAFVDRPYSCSRHAWARCPENYTFVGLGRTG